LYCAQVFGQNKHGGFCQCSAQTCLFGAMTPEGAKYSPLASHEFFSKETSKKHRENRKNDSVVVSSRVSP
jgi:hypothetical protein